MSYKPTYQAELLEDPIKPTIVPLDLDDLEDTPPAPVATEPVASTQACPPADIAPKPEPFEFLDLDEIQDAPVREESLAVPLADKVNPLPEEPLGAPVADKVDLLPEEPKSTQPPRPSLAVRGVEEALNAPRRIAMQQAINSWTVASGVLKMIIMHPGYASSIEDKLSGIEVTRHALDQVAAKVGDELGFPKTEGGRQKVRRHILPVLESVWGYLFSKDAPEMDVDQVVAFTSKFLSDAADLVSADPDELFLRSNQGLDMALARLTAMTRIQCELQPIFDTIDKYTQRNEAVGHIFFGDMTRREVLDDIYRMVEARAQAFLEGVDLDKGNSHETTILNRVVLRQSVDLMSGILRSETAMAKLSAFAKESTKKEGVLKDWLVAQFETWTEGMPSLAGLMAMHSNEQENPGARKGPVL
jgi:hypothetical protein